METAAIGKPISRLADEEKTASLYESAGRFLKSIHDIKVEGFGSFILENKMLKGELLTWKENVIQFRPDFEFLLQNELVTTKAYDIVIKNYEDTVNLELVQASFNHGDFSPQHLYSNGEQITSIIDLGNCYAGDPRKDIATMHYFLNENEIRFFDKGYGISVEDVDVIKKYTMMLAVSKLKYRITNNYTDRIPYAMQALKKALL